MNTPATGIQVNLRRAHAADAIAGAPWPPNATRDVIAAEAFSRAKRMHGAGLCDELFSALITAMDAVPDVLRMTPEEVGNLCQDVRRPPSSIDFPIHHRHREKQATRGEEGAPEGSEAAIAEFLASTDLSMRLRWSDSAQSWHAWDGIRWTRSADRIPLELQRAVGGAIATGVQGLRLDLKSIPRLASASGVRGIGTLLSAWTTMKMWAEVDPPGFIACPSYVLKLSTGEKLAHDPSRAITRACPVDPGPSCLLWGMVESHLKECLGDTYDAVHRFLGAALMGRPADRRLLWLFGEAGGDGKSTLVRILGHALGDHFAVVAAESFGDGARGAHGHELASPMYGARMAASLEIRGRLNWSLLKVLSGADGVVTKRLHSRAVTFNRAPYLILVSNEKPVPPDNPIAERIILAELRPPADRDERLAQVLSDGGRARDELASAALSWLIAGCSEFLEHGIGPVRLCRPTPAGLDLWWSQSVYSGAIVPRCGAVLLSEAATHYNTWALATGNTTRSQGEVAQFLRCLVGYKRTKRGVEYELTLKEPV